MNEFLQELTVTCFPEAVYRSLHQQPILSAGFPYRCQTLAGYDYYPAPATNRMTKLVSARPSIYSVQRK